MGIDLKKTKGSLEHSLAEGAAGLAEPRGSTRAGGSVQKAGSQGKHVFPEGGGVT